MTECARREINTENCACSSESCERRGMCCACIAYHREGGALPACVRDLAQDES